MNRSKTIRAPFIIFLLATSISFLSLASCSAQNPTKNEQLEGKWFVNFIHEDIGQARTIIEFHTASNTFTASTRKDADTDILGNWTSFLSRTFTKSLKNGSLLNIEKGRFQILNDTVQLKGILATPMGNYNLEGYITHGTLHTSIRNKSKGQLGSITGNRNIPTTPLENYDQVFKDALSLTETKIFNKEILDSREWRSFTKQMHHTLPKLQDDLEFIFSFFYNARKLHFSHYSLLKPSKKIKLTNYTPSAKQLILEEKDAHTAYLRIISFGGTAQEVDSVFKTIDQKGYQNLIVDLRNNAGGSIEAGMAFATHILDKETFGGVFLTQKWFENHPDLPTPSDYAKLPHFTEANYDLILKGIHAHEGLCLKIIPKEPVYTGNLYILTNKKTASTCEPIVYELKKQKRALIIGNTTAGAMLNGELLELNKGFEMVIPTATYYTSDGFQIDQKGVKPNIETKSNDALETTLDLIKQL